MSENSKTFFNIKKWEYPHHVTIGGWRNWHTKHPQFKPPNIKHFLGIDHCSVVLDYDNRTFMFETAEDQKVFTDALEQARVGE
jgi:hypothetical protein